MAFRVLLKITDLLAPRASTKVMHSVMENAMKSGALPNIVPTEAAIERLISPPDSESKLADNAHAHALVPIRYSRIIFHPMTKATNSPTDTYE